MTEGHIHNFVIVEKQPSLKLLALYKHMRNRLGLAKGSFWKLIVFFLGDKALREVREL